MGEYASYGGKEIKIGTCEDMYYLRADQAYAVRPLSGNVDPVKDRDGIRFRFPFPDEDGTAPGAFENYNRGVHVPGLTAPDDFEHGTVQFSAPAGYLVSLPCPETPPTTPGFVTTQNGLTIHRNGFAGAVHIVQRRWWDGRLVLVCRCGGCGAKYRLPTFADAEPVIVACRQQADHDASRAVWWHAIADRIATGYGTVHS